MFAANARLYFYIFIAILVLLFAESIREVRKYSDPLDLTEVKHHAQAAETFHHMKLFRAQRNLHISGFALFLWFILRRLVILVSREATLMAESEASYKQAQSASAVAQQLMDEKVEKDDNKKNAATEGDVKKSSKSEPADQTAIEKDLAQTQAELEKTKEELYKAKLDFESMKKQAESTNKEYDRLLLEHEKLQNQAAEGEGGKKDN